MSLSHLTTPAPDGILKLMRAFAEDPRPGKIDLGVGVYRTETGATPIMAAVKAAERTLLEDETTKSYVGLAGDPAFLEAVRTLTLGPSVAQARIAAIATTGGTAAVRHAFDLHRIAAPEGRVWMSDPTWPNHPAILAAVGQPTHVYRYLDRAAGALDRDGMLQDLQGLQPGDALLLHGCCHNPSGVDLALPDWQQLAALCASREVLPIVDLAYQGFAVGLEDDVAGLRALAAAVPEMLLCVSGSKNFGLYRERVGALLAVTPGGSARETTAAHLMTFNRLSYTFPPDHGARLVTMVLGDLGLRALWQSELAGMRDRVNAMRVALAQALRAETGSDRFGALADHRGMFSLLPATPDQMERLRVEHGLYAVADGRINVAGLTPDNVGAAARAIATVLR